MTVLQQEKVKKLRKELKEIREAIYLHCYDCMGYLADGYQDCGMEGRCLLYSFRLGRPPFSKKLALKMKELKRRMQNF